MLLPDLKLGWKRGVKKPAAMEPLDLQIGSDNLTQSGTKEADKTKVSMLSLFKLDESRLEHKQNGGEGFLFATGCT